MEVSQFEILGNSKEPLYAQHTEKSAPKLDSKCLKFESANFFAHIAKFAFTLQIRTLKWTMVIETDCYGA